MKQAISRISILTVIFAATISLVTVLFANLASAHVVVRPAEVVTAGFQTFTVSVPNEKNIPTTSVELLIPEGLNHIAPTQKSGWIVSTETEGDGEEARVVSITWRDGEIGIGLRDEFTFSAQVPDTETELQWKAYQTYKNGVVVAWDQESEGGHDTHGDSGPSSVTNVVSVTEADKAVEKAERAAADALAAGNRSFYIAVAALALALVGAFFALRRK